MDCTGVIPANLSPTRGEASSGDNKKSTSVTYGAAILHSRQSQVQTFSANRTDDAFDVSSLPRRPRSAEHFFDIHCRDLVAELLAIDSIPQQISRHSIKRKGFEHLLRRPFRRWMSCDVEVHDASSIVCEDNKNEEDFEPNGVDGEKVDGCQLRNVIIAERPPRLRWRFWGFGPCIWQSKPRRS